MKLFKFFNLAILAGCLLISLPIIVNAQETTNEELANVLTEFETDEIDAKSLNIEEPSTLPGQFSYNWQLLKENVGLFFTFKPEKKIEKLEEISNRRLLEAKQLSENSTNNAADRVAEALKRYEQARQKITTRLEANPELKNKLLEKFDANQLKHQQVLSTVTEKLRDKASDEQLENIEKIKKANALRWYDTQREKIQERLEKAVANNNVGSKFKQLKNIAALEELSETLPEEARDKIEAAKIKAEERLADKMTNLNEQDREKFEKYVNNLKMPELIKQRLVSDLKDNQELPESIRDGASNLFTNYSNTLRTRFENLSPAEQQKFLDQFKNDLESHPAYMEILQNLKNTENKAQIQNILERQADALKARIQQVTDPATLRNMEQNLQNYPVLRKQIQAQKMELEKEATSVMPKRTASPTE